MVLFSSRVMRTARSNRYIVRKLHFKNVVIHYYLLPIPIYRIIENKIMFIYSGDSRYSVSCIMNFISYIPKQQPILYNIISLTDIRRTI